MKKIVLILLLISAVINSGCDNKTKTPDPGVNPPSANGGGNVSTPPTTGGEKVSPTPLVQTAKGDGAAVIQTIAEFHRPESSAFSLDGKTLFVTNCGSGFYGEKELFALANGKGAISKLSVDEKGKLTMLNPKFVVGLNGPLGIGVLPRATAKFPAGTLFVNTGFFMQTDENDEYITDLDKIDTSIKIINPDSGAIIGKIDLGVGSPVAMTVKNEFIIPNGMAFDPDGNLYIAETGGKNEIATPNYTSLGGVLRIPQTAIDTLADGHSDKNVVFVAVPGEPNGTMYDGTTNSIYVVTCGEGDNDPNGGAVFNIPCVDFGKKPLPDPLSKQLGRLDGIVKNFKGELIISLFDGSIIAVAEDGMSRKMTFSPEMNFKAPSDLKLRRLKDGSEILIIPEQDAKGEGVWKQRLRVIRL